MADPGRLDELKRKFDENPKRYFAPLANEYRKAGQPDLAIELCRTYLPQQPNHMSGYIVYGQALHDAGHGDESAAVFKQALTLDPENIIALRHLGDISRDAGDNVGAMRWYGKVLELDPRNEEIAAYITSLAQPGSRQGARAPERPAPPSIRPEPAQDDSAVSLEDIVSEPDSEQAPIAPDQIVFSHTQEMLQVQAEEPFEVTDWPNVADPDDTLGADNPLLHGSWSATPEESPEESPEEWPAEPSEDSREETPAQLEQVASDDYMRDAAEPLSTPEESADNASVTAAAEPAAAPRETSPFVTETMAELYVRQGLHGEALAIYRELVIRRDDPALRQKIADIEVRQNASSAPETVRRFFARIGARRPNERVEMAAQRHSSLGALLGQENLNASDRSAAEKLSGAFGGQSSGAQRS